MRVTTRKVALAFKEGRRLKVNNTHTDGTTFYLFGNPIARKVGDRLEISWAGWPTRTTTERLRGVLQTFGSSMTIGPDFEGWKTVPDYIKELFQ